MSASPIKYQYHLALFCRSHSYAKVHTREKNVYSYVNNVLNPVLNSEVEYGRFNSSLTYIHIHI